MQAVAAYSPARRVMARKKQSIARAASAAAGIQGHVPTHSSVMPACEQCSHCGGSVAQQPMQQQPHPRSAIWYTSDDAGAGPATVQHPHGIPWLPLSTAPPQHMASLIPVPSPMASGRSPLRRGNSFGYYAPAPKPFGAFSPPPQPMPHVCTGIHNHGHSHGHGYAQAAPGSPMQPSYSLPSALPGRSPPAPRMRPVLVQYY